MSDTTWAPPSTPPPPPSSPGDHDVAVQQHSDAYWYATCHTCGWASRPCSLEHEATVAAGHHHQAVEVPWAKPKKRRAGKVIGFGLLAFLGLGVIGALASVGDTDLAAADSQSPVGSSNSYSEAECTSRAKQNTARLAGITDDIRSTSPGDDARIRNLIRRTRDAITEGRQIHSDCGHYAPGAALEASLSLDGLERSVDEMENILNDY